MLRDETSKYVENWLEAGQTGDYEFNCAESILRGINDYYNLDLDEDVLKIAASWGSGMYSEETCGIITAGCAGLSMLFASDKTPYANDKVKRFTSLWVQKVKEKYGSVSCKELKEFGNCKDLVVESADIFESTINSYNL